MKQWPKRILFSLLPAAFLLASAEIIIRLADLTRPSIFTLPLPEEEAKSSGVLMFDAHENFHPRGVPPAEIFIDYWHPTQRGHVRLASALSHSIAERRD